VAVHVKEGRMTDVLDICGLVALVVMGFLVALAVGFGVLGCACLWASWSITRERRRVAQVAEARRAAAAARMT
jgi:hypothetical protein